MIKVIVADLVWYEDGGNFVVILRDEGGRRVLPIWIGANEAWAIALYLNRHKMYRPMAVDLLANLMEATGGMLEKVVIETLKAGAFQASVKVRQGNRMLAVDARPSDAIALALRQESPIYVAQEVMDRWGIKIQSGKETPQWGRGLEVIAREWKGSFQEAESPPPPPDEKEVAEVYRHLLDFIMGK